MSILDSLPHRCVIGRQTRSNDSLGANLYGFVIERTDVECWEQAASANDIMEFDKRSISISTKVYFTEDLHLTEQHRILITRRSGVATPNQDITDVNNPDTFDVMSFAYPDASAGLGVLFRAMCKSSTGNQP